MKELIDVARRLEGMAQNAADHKINQREGSAAHNREHYRMVELLELAQVIHNHIAECPTCKPSQSR